MKEKTDDLVVCRTILVTCMPFGKACCSIDKGTHMSSRTKQALQLPAHEPQETKSTVFQAKWPHE